MSWRADATRKRPKQPTTMEAMIHCALLCDWIVLLQSYILILCYVLSSPCNTTSKLSPSHVIRGKASPTQLLLIGTQKPQADLILTFEIFKCEVDLSPSDVFLRQLRAVLRGYTYRLLQGPSRLRRRSGAFSVGVVKCWD